MNEYDGTIVIGTTIDETGFDKKITQLQDRAENKKIQIELQTEKVDQTKKELQELIDKREEYLQKLGEIGPKAERIAELEFKGLSKLTQKETMEYAALTWKGIDKEERELLDKINEIEIKTKRINEKLGMQNDRLLAQKNNYTDIVEKIKQVEEKQKQTELKNISMGVEQANEKLKDTNIELNKIPNSISKITKKIGRWALAIFGIRSAYMFIRRSISTLSQYNEKLAADIQNIQYALASALEPIILRIIELVYKLLGYIAYIIKAWTGKNIFQNANKNLKSATKQAKELQKTLAGFDEMNILGKNTQASGNVAPSVDLSKIQGKVPGWVEWIARNGKLLLSIISGLVAGIIALKLGLKGIKSLGIGIAVAGLVYTIGSIIEYLNDPSWSNFGNILIGIGVTLGGLAILFGSLPLALAAAIALMLGIIGKFWDKIQEFLTNLKNNIIQLGDDIRKWLHENLGILGDLIGAAIQGFLGIFTSTIDAVISLFDGLFTGIKGIIDGIVTVFRGSIGEGLVKILKGAINIMIGLINFLIDGLNAVLSPIRALVVVIGNIMGNDWSLEDVKVKHIAKLERGGIVHSPGQGILMGSYIAGEGASPEAVLPLNDETLDKLGEKIAKHMTINANITNTMNGRVISRELQKINNENAFAYNG